MKATVVEAGRRRWKVQIRHGNQFFYLTYEASKRDCEWMARMFNNALAKHDEEKRK